MRCDIIANLAVYHCIVTIATSIPISTTPIDTNFNEVYSMSVLGSSPFALRFCPIAFAIDFDVKLNISPTIITTKPIITESCLNLSQ